MREEIWTEKIFKDDAGYFLRITKRTFTTYMEKIDINANKSEAARCLKCRNARCSAACPVHTDIPALMSLYLQGKKDEAAAILLRNNPMAAISSRVCDWSRVCLSRCILNARQSPVNWHSVEAEIAGDAIFRMKVRPGDATGKSVGIIGAGPAGISAAIWLREAGHDVVIYDIYERPGGVLRYGIPEFRLDRKYIDRYEVILEEAGVAFRGGTIVGKDVTLRELREKHDAVLIAAGAGIPRKLDVPGEENANVIYALDYLKDPSAYNLGRNVIVIGGGNVTMDACRTAVRQGCSDRGFPVFARAYYGLALCPWLVCDKSCRHRFVLPVEDRVVIHNGDVELVRGYGLSVHLLEGEADVVRVFLEIDGFLHIVVLADLKLGDSVEKRVEGLV